MCTRVCARVCVCDCMCTVNPPTNYSLRSRSRSSPKPDKMTSTIHEEFSLDGSRKGAHRLAANNSKTTKVTGNFPVLRHIRVHLRTTDVKRLSERRRRAGRRGWQGERERHMCMLAETRRAIGINNLKRAHTNTYSSNCASVSECVRARFNVYKCANTSPTDALRTHTHTHALAVTTTRAERSTRDEVSSGYFRAWLRFAD